LEYPAPVRRVLITGASGLVGGRLLAQLRERGDFAVRASSRREREWPSGIDGVVAAPSQPDTLSRACDGCECVINLASMSEAAAAADPAGALNSTTGGALAWSRAAKDAGVGRFVQLSTIKVYGASPAGCIDEDTPTQPRSPYAIAHRAAEDYAQYAIADSVVLRLSNGFGVPAGDAAGAWDVIVSEFCKQAVTTHAITIRSSGETWRSFLPLDDVAAALIAAMRLPAGVYNLGAARAMTLRDAAERVAAVAQQTLGLTPVVRTGPPDPAPPAALDYRIDKLRAAGFEPRASFDDEVSRVLDAARREFRSNPA
jgi:UDP-glucose 4-epimerase